MTTLLEKLYELDDELPLKIGAVDGSSYFYCGTVGEFRRRIDEYSAKGEKLYRESAEKSKKAYDDLSNRSPVFPNGFYNLLEMKLGGALKEMAHCVTDPARTPMQVKMVRYIGELGKWARATDIARRRAKSANSLFSEWSPYGERRVREFFMADNVAEPDATMVIHIDGYELGSYWLISDAKKKPGFSLKAIGIGDEVVDE